MNYSHKEIENRWQKIWNEKKIFEFDESAKENQKYYVLEMFPYPSGKIHMGHLRNYAIGDCLARFKKLQGFNVLHPMGFDAFGLPAENAALEHKIHPEKWTLSNIENMTEELKSIGLAIDWTRKLATCLPDYYKHEQKIFIDFLKNGLAYQKESFVNWDPIDQTVLANEQVVDGRGWRSGALVEKKKLKQWFLKVSDFSEELLSELDNLSGWDERVISMQKKWIGKSEGLLIDFEIIGKNEKLKIYTTRPDTIFGASFVAISPNHPLAEELSQSNSNIKDFIDECNRNAVDAATIEKQEKLGINTGLKVTHPFDKNWQIDVFIANFVLMDYGTGAVFACPAHDERDFEFAKKYYLPIKQVVAGNAEPQLSTEDIYTGEGVMINSDFLNGLTNIEAKEKVSELLEKKGTGERKINYRLRDWGVSRQRYWGCPIPILYLEDGTVVPVPEDQLPVELPKDVEFTGAGNPLGLHPTWKHTTYKMPDGREVKATRETDTFDTFFESSWYFLRYISQPNDKAFDQNLVNRVMPVDQYIGGVEHAVLHLLYARFFTKALKKCGYLNISEPFANLLTQGMVCHQTYKDKSDKWVHTDDVTKGEDGKFYHAKTKEELAVGRSEKMSKSKKNVVEPAGIIEQFGADTARLFMLSDSPPTRDLEWSDAGIDGCYRYINRLWRLVENFAESAEPQFGNKDLIEIPQQNLKDEAKSILKLTHKTIKEVESEFSKMGFNRAIAKIRELSNTLEKFEAKSDEEKSVMNFALKNLVILVAPIMPHLAEELWQKLGQDGLVSTQNFPKFDEKLVEDDAVKIAVQVLGKLRAVIEMPKDSSKEDLEKAALENENVKKFIDGKTIKKMIVVPGRLVNIVV